jgi:hypothetical protein
MQADGVTPCSHGAFADIYAYNSNGTVWAKALQYTANYNGSPVAGTLGSLYCAYDARGNVMSIAYPNEWLLSGPNEQYNYAEDTMGRMNGLQYLNCPGGTCPPTGSQEVSNVTYSPANQLLTIK